MDQDRMAALSVPDHSKVHMDILGEESQGTHVHDDVLLGEDTALTEPANINSRDVVEEAELAAAAADAAIQAVEQHEAAVAYSHASHDDEQVADDAMHVVHPAPIQPPLSDNSNPALENHHHLPITTTAQVPVADPIPLPPQPLRTATKLKTDKPPKKSGQKRIRRVGLTPTRITKQPKLDSDEANIAVSMTEHNPSAAVVPLIEENIAYKVQSKHDEKWNVMLQKLLEYKKQHGNTLVPQCYHQDPRLGRWGHYQRVEYWLYQSTGKGKISPERIAKLNAIGFEWDPQRARWNILYQKLVEFCSEHGHCRVPKGYQHDPELANWVRNQRLEYANMQKGKKSRMTKDRLDKLTEIGFKWSTSSTNNSNVQTMTTYLTKSDEAVSESEKHGIDNNTNPTTSTTATGQQQQLPMSEVVQAADTGNNDAELPPPRPEQPNEQSPPPNSYQQYNPESSSPPQHFEEIK